MPTLTPILQCFFVKRTIATEVFTPNVNTGTGIAYTAEIQGDLSIRVGLELDFLRVRKELTIGTSLTGPYIKTGDAAADVNGGTVAVNSSKVSLQVGTLLSDWQATGDVTKINGGKVYTGTIIASALAFTPLISAGGTGAVVATINASAEGIRISAAKIEIDGTVTFASGYDPTTKVAAGGAAADVNANATTISGGKITANSISVDKLTAGTLTGFVIQTSANNERIVLTTDKLSYYAGASEQFIIQSAYSSGPPITRSLKFLDIDTNEYLKFFNSSAVGKIVYITPTLSGTTIYASTALSCGGADLFAVNASGQITKVNNVSATAKYVLIGDGTSFTPRLLAISDLPALTANKVLLSDGSGVVSASSISNTALSYLDATSSIQTQLNAKLTAALSSDLSWTGTHAFSKPITFNNETSISVTGTGNYSVANKNVVILNPTASSYIVTLTDMGINQPILVMNASTSYTVTLAGYSNRTLAARECAIIWYNATVGAYMILKTDP